MAGRGRITREAIVDQARRIVAGQGFASLTFQALAEALGVSKQAIIYWFPTKWDLALAYALRVLDGEAEATIPAARDAGSAASAIEAFVRALVGHYLKNLGDFRVLYLAPQFDRSITPGVPSADTLGPIHEKTSAIYAALEAKIALDPEFRPGVSPRRLAVAAHMAGIGLITMLAMADAVNDPFKHSSADLLDALVALLTQPAPTESKARGRRPAQRATAPR
jgi:AcrR family transcriptional regulator